MKFTIYLLVTAGVTYLVRLVPMIALKKKIRNQFLLSFLHYVPYAVLSVMTVPAIFSAAEDLHSALAGFAVAMLLAWREKSLVAVAAAACLAVFLFQTVF